MESPSSLPQSMRSLSVGSGNTDECDSTSVSKPLDEQIIEIIESIPDRTIRPGRLAADLGISVEDASAELCGLLAAVGGGSDGATFRFEKFEGCNALANRSVLTMVFTFPPNFRRRALSNRRRDDMWQATRSSLKVLVKGLKIVTAAGLILSLIIVCVVAILTLIAGIIVLARSGDRRQTSSLTHQIRTLISMIRQVLWCYALFGPGINSDDDYHGSGGQDPFFREVAYDLWLLLSVCCGNPTSFFYWIRASELNNRTRRFRSWRNANFALSSGTTPIHGVTIVSQESNSFLARNSSEHQGLLSVAVEFLFGPTPFTPRPSVEDIWKLRASFIIEASTKRNNVSLEAFAPYVDYPPKSFDDASMLVSQCLNIASFFNGLPVDNEKSMENTRLVSKEEISSKDLLKTKFIFPELTAETTMASRYDYQPEPDDGTWASFMYSNDETSRPQKLSSNLPTYLKEERFKFTKLSRQQVVHCLVLGSLNFFGVLWFGQSIAVGGILDVTGTPLQFIIRQVLYPILRFYAILFFCIPTGRIVLLLVLNKSKQERNKRRARLVQRSLKE